MGEEEREGGGSRKGGARRGGDLQRVEQIGREAGEDGRACKGGMMRRVSHENRADDARESAHEGFEENVERI